MSCYKRAFENEGIAEVILTDIKAKGGRDVQKLITYQCDKCHMWHFTSNNNYKKNGKWLK